MYFTRVNFYLRLDINYYRIIIIKLFNYFDIVVCTYYIIIVIFFYFYLKFTFNPFQFNPIFYIF